MFMCVLLSIIMISRSWRFTCFQMKNLFRTPRENSIILRETSSEIRYQFFFSLQGVLLLAMFVYTLARHLLNEGEDYSVGDYQLIAIYGGVILLYRLLCEGLEDIVLPIYFKNNQRLMWKGSRQFLIALQGALLLPVALVYFYFHLDIHTTIMVTIGIIATTLLLRFYKAYCIFFQKSNAFLQFFLYLCTLKVIPLALLTIVSLFIANYLKINI